MHGASYANISRESAEMIRVMTNSPIKISKKEERVDMCKALEQMMYDARTEGKAEQKEYCQRFPILLKMG